MDNKDLLKGPVYVGCLLITAERTLSIMPNVWFAKHAAFRIASDNMLDLYCRVASWKQS